MYNKKYVAALCGVVGSLVAVQATFHNGPSMQFSTMHPGEYRLEVKKPIKCSNVNSLVGRVMSVNSDIKIEPISDGLSKKVLAFKVWPTNPKLSSGYSRMNDDILELLENCN